MPPSVHCRHRSGTFTATPPASRALLRRTTNRMDHSMHMPTFTELDLTTACYPKPMSRWVNVFPALRTTTAFFTFLRANLALAPSVYCQVPSTPPRGSLPPPSYINTTQKDARTHAHRRRRSRNSNPPSTTTATMPDDPPAGAPPLALEVLTTKADKAAAMRLIADSVSQQRAAASLHLVFHPVCVAVLIAGLAAAYYYGSLHDKGMLITLLCGVVMTYLMAIRFVTAGYLSWAESLGWDWLRPSTDAEEDTVIGTRYGDNIIGAVVLRLEPSMPSTSSGNGGATGSQKRRARKDSHGSNSGAESPKIKGGKGVIRAWTTQMRYRGNGVGQGLLQEAVRLTRERCGKDAEVGFALEHVHARKVLPEILMKPMRRIERKAAKALDGVVGEKRKR